MQTWLNDLGTDLLDGLLAGPAELRALRATCRDLKASMIGFESATTLTWNRERDDGPRLTEADLRVLPNCPRLRELVVWAPRGEDLNPLPAYAPAGLDTLRCMYGRDADLAPLAAALASMAGLRNLNLFSFDSVSDLGPLSALTQLTRFCCDECNLVSTIVPLSGGLVSLNFNATRVEDIGPLAAFTGLLWLSFNRTPVRDLAPLSGLVGLYHLNFSHVGHVADLAALSGLVRLETICFTGCGLVSDLRPLAALTRLRYLSCAGTAVTDLAPLSGLFKLAGLACSGTKVTDLAPLSGLATLRSLDLESCSEITSLAPLSALTGLKRLYLSEGCASDVSVLRGLPGLSLMMT